MINLEQLIAFVCGMLVVYLMFRAMGVICLLGLLLICSSASAQSVGVTNWPSASDPMAVTAAVDVWPACAAGFGFGLTVCGFGWVIRMVKKTGSAHD